MKDITGDSIFLGALFYPGSSSNTIFFLQIICLGFNLIDQIIKMSSIS